MSSITKGGTITLAIHGFTEGADPEYEEQILPLAAECLGGAKRVIDVGTGSGVIALAAAGLKAQDVLDARDSLLRDAKQHADGMVSSATAEADSTLGHSRGEADRLDVVWCCIVAAPRRCVST